MGRTGAYVGHYSKFDLLEGISAFPGNIYEFGIDDLAKVRISTISSDDGRPPSDQEYHFCEKVPQEDKFVCLGETGMTVKASMTSDETSAYDCIYYCRNKNLMVIQRVLSCAGYKLHI